MVNSIAASLALFGAVATASSLSAGEAQVVNKCSYDVYLCNVPAEGGGYSQQDKTLSPGDSWSQTWTELSNGQGWSIKLSNSTSLESILQYEYTFHNDGTIWFDLSCVNGDPWPENWEITGDNGCDPKQTAYRYPTDDDYGMQACTQDATVLVTLCASEDGDDSSDSSSSAAAPAYTSTSSVYSAPAYSSSSSEEAPAYTSSSSSAYSAPSATGYSGWWSNGNGVVEAAEGYTAPAAATPTTLATSTTAVVSKAADGADVTVVEVVTAVETAIVTAYGRHRRHEHHVHQHHA